MNEQMRCAYVIAQAAMLNARIAGMQAENQARNSAGLAPAYDEKTFVEVAEESGLGHNDVITYLRGD